jgi:CBS domain-containing protein
MSDAMDESEKGAQMKNGNTDLKKFTTRHLIVVHWMSSLSVGFELLRRNQIMHLPVVDDGGSIIGIISDRDFQRAMQIDQADFQSGKVPQAEFDPNARIRDFMSWPVQAISEDSSQAEAARLMLDKRISSLVVTRRDQVVGIVTTEDMLRALLEQHESFLGELKEDVRSAFYNSTIGQIATALSNAGI